MPSRPISHHLHMHRATSPPFVKGLAASYGNVDKDGRSQFLQKQKRHPASPTPLPRFMSEPPSPVLFVTLSLSMYMGCKT